MISKEQLIEMGKADSCLKDAKEHLDNLFMLGAVDDITNTILHEGYRLICEAIEKI